VGIKSATALALSAVLVVLSATEFFVLKVIMFVKKKFVFIISALLLELEVVFAEKYIQYM
jgi:hypothetical protein